MDKYKSIDSRRRDGSPEEAEKNLSELAEKASAELRSVDWGSGWGNPRLDQETSSRFRNWGMEMCRLAIVEGGEETLRPVIERAAKAAYNVTGEGYNGHRGPTPDRFMDESAFWAALVREFVSDYGPPDSEA